MSAPDFPSFSDGRRAVRFPTVKCYNHLVSSAARQYHYIEDDIKHAGLSVDHMLEGDGEHVGGYAKAGLRSGNLAIQLDAADDPVPLPGHVIGLTKNSGTEEFYVVTDTSAPNKRNDQVRLALTVKRIINPFFTGLLSSDLGDSLAYTFSKAAGNASITAAPVNHRSGATKAYSGIQSDGTALPAGLTVNAATGVIDITAATIATGSYEIEVIATDTLSGKRTLSGSNVLKLTVTA